MRGRLALILTLILAATAGPSAAARFTVTFVSIEAVYVNAGTKAGLVRGDTLRVVTRERRGQLLIVTNLSSHSSACKPADPDAVFNKDDVVEPVRRLTPPEEIANAKAANAPRRMIETRRRKQRGEPISHVRGFLSMQTRWQRDLSGSNVSWMQPGVSGKISVTNIDGRHLNFRMRHSSRYSYRSYSIGSAPGSSDQWTHRLSELSLTYQHAGSPVEAGFGRVISPYIRGVGYIDGAYVAVNPRGKIGYGMAAGTEPYSLEKVYNPDARKIGFFMTRNAGTDQEHLSTTVAISGSYNRNVVSREFVYVQNVLSHSRTLNIFQSVEIDINRHWRKTEGDGRFSFSNFYMTANWMVSDKVSIDGSIDARKNILTYAVKDTPDSLFDRSLQQGFDGGVSLRFPKDVSLRANGGVRFGQTDAQDNYFASIFLHARNFMKPGRHLSARLSRSKTQFTTTWGPLATYNFPLTRRTQAYLSTGGYLYNSQGTMDNNVYVEGGGHRTLLQRYYTSASWRQYLSGSLKSTEINVELGVTF